MQESTQTSRKTADVGVLHPSVSYASSTNSERTSDALGADYLAIVEGAHRSTPFSVSKRILDVVGALTIGVLALPVMIIVAAVIRLSGSPVVFSHTRIGKHHEPFRCYKFRTMVPDAEEKLKKILASNPEALREWRENHKLKDDPRITRFGSFLRKSSLDELPQLWNVLVGDMSLVGPRPIVADELERYGNKARIYCSVKPGMTGLWQIMGRSSVTYSRRVSLDLLYVRQQNILTDFWILARTIGAVIRRAGAH